MICAPVIPATPLEEERDEQGRLLALRAGEQTYLQREGDTVVLGDGLVRIRELALPAGRLRYVRTGRARWVERYEWDAAGRPVHVDGVDITRDDDGRVVACGDDWRYRYGDAGLEAIAGPFGERRIERAADGRPLVAVVGRGLPPAYRRDEFGRTWCVLGPDGEIATTWLWDGLACFGRIDGPPGEPLAAAFTLDPSLTPVRAVAADATVTRIVRDAFGEGLLAHPGVPGLFGGVVHDDLVHTRARALDPRHGCWDRPDPWHGHPGDPRRAGGYHGPLPVEGPTGDAYTVCRGDPVGRADPTGEVSGWLLLSDLFWSHPNNLLGIFGLDLTVNFWASLFTGRGGRWFSFEGLSSTSEMGAFGMRRDGLTVYSDRAWTFQHLVFATAEHLDELSNARLFDPKGAWEPSLYGTVLVVRPAGADAFVLRGTNHRTPVSGGASVARAPGWTRAGGPAVALVPGSQVPRFPSGALHFDKPRGGLRGRAAEIVEAAATTAPLPGTVAATEAYRLELAERDAPAAGARMVLRTAGAVTRIVRFADSVDKRDGKARVVIDPEPGDPPGGDPRLHPVPAAGAVETLSPVAGSPRLLVLPAGSAAAYAAGDAVRLAQPPGPTAAPVGAAVVTALETRLTLDAAVAGFRAGVAVHEAAGRGGGHGATLSADKRTLTVAAGVDGPGSGALVLVSSGATALPARVGDDGTTLDRALTGLAAGAVTWRELARGRRVGGRETAPDPAAAAISYVPETLHRVPAAGTVVWIEGSGAPVAVRSVVALEREAIELDHDLPPDQARDYAVERMALGPARTVQKLQAQRTVQLAAQPGPLNAAALELVALSAPALAAGTVLLAGAALAGARLTLSPPPAAPGSRPFPGQVVAVSGGGAVAPAVVKSVRVDVTFDRDIGATTHCRLAVLEDDGPLLDAISEGHPNLVVLPRTGGGVRTEQPRFAAGETIEVTPAGGGAALLFAVTAADGARVTLAGPVNLPAAGTAAHVRRLSVGTPSVDRGPNPAGTTVAGVNGNRRAAANAREWSFDIWRPNAVGAGLRVGIDDGTTTQPAKVDRVDAVVVELTAAPAGVAGPTADLAEANVASITHATRFAQSGPLVVVDESLLPAAGANAVLVVPLAEQGAARPGDLGSGGVLIPNRLETELDRRASLVEHELRHTIQSAKCGPLLLGMFPLGALQAVFEVFSDADMPAFSPYVAATLTADGSRRLLQISRPEGYAEDGEVQVSVAGQVQTEKLGQKQPDGRFSLSLPPAIPNGEVFVRRLTDTTPNQAWSGIINVGQFLTPGGLMNFLTGTIWGGLFFLIAHGLHALANLGERTTYAATVEDDGRAVRLNEAASAVSGAAQVVVIAGEAQTVRAVDRVDGLLVRLAAPVAARGAVEVAPFTGESPDSLWDWHDYFPASVPDPARPASLRLEAVGGERLELRVHDRVQVRSGSASTRTNVTAVAGTGDAATVELEHRPPGGGGGQPGDVQIAKVAEDDPMGNTDSFLLNEMGMGWMRWMFDPYGQLLRPADSEPGDFADLALRTARSVASTQAWPLLLPIPGWFFLDNAFKQPNDAHLSQMEQDASSNSGDLYSTIARLASVPSHVGDIGQYWVFEQFRENSSIETARGDAPGVAHKPYPRLIPKRTPDPGGADLNRGSQAPPLPAAPAPGPGDEVAGVFWSKGGDTRDTPAGARMFPPAQRGWVPTSPTMERAVGAYVAFTRPSGAGDKHRVTAADLPSNEANDRAAHEARKSTVLWDLDIQDVEVKVAGRIVLEGATVELVATERARVAANPGGARVYAVTVAAPPGAVATADPADRTIVRADKAPAAAPAAVDVEVSRLHAFRAGSFATPALRSHPFDVAHPPAAVHLPADIHIPVRRFSVTATTSLPARTAVDLLPASVLAPATALKPGEHCFLVVPTDVLPGSPTIGAPSYPGVAPALAAGMTAPGIKVDVEALPAALLADIPHGAAFKLTVKAAEPPEAACELPVATRVGRGADTATLRTVVKLAPHFTLDLPAAAADNKVTRGPAGGVTLHSNGATPVAAVTIEPPGGVTATVTATDVVITVEAGADTTARKITVTDAANPAHKARRTIVIV